MPNRIAFRCVDCKVRPVLRRGRCAPCGQRAELRRGRRQDRGYGVEYEQERRRVLAAAEACGRCGGPFTPEDPPTAGHIVPVVRGGGVLGNLRAEHSSCNYAAGAR